MSRLHLLVPAVLLCAALTVSGCSSGNDGSNSSGSTTSQARPDEVATTAPVGTDVCAGPDGVGGTVPAGAQPGDLVASSAYPSTDAGGSPLTGFPTGATVQRMLYVSTGADETDLQLVCGTATIPDTGPTTTADGHTRVLAWAHGTQGLEQSCLPSQNPASYIWGPMPGGIQTVAWGSPPAAQTGTPANGQLQYAVDQGWIVATTDYQPVDTYVIGRVAGANVLDSVRAARQLAAAQFRESADLPSDLVVVGHSQGGHAALWAGQLADPYFSATGTSPEQIRLRGVEALAPAANFIVQPDRQPGTRFGDGLADREMHQALGLIPGDAAPDTEIQIGPALFSYIFGSWSQFSAGTAPAGDSRTPAGPPTGPLDLSRVATEQGAGTIRTVQPLCLTGTDALTVKAAVAPYGDAATNQMLVPELWNLPADYSGPGQYFTGGVDRTCGTAPETLGGWCDWITWNLPGPLGTNPFPKTPTSRGAPVPLMIAQGTNDTVIHCVAPNGLPSDRVPGVGDCTSVALYESMVPAYCPSRDGGAALQLRLFRPGPDSPANHFSIPGEMAANSLSATTADLTYTGSPSQQFVQGAFDGTLPGGCSATVLNP